MIDFGRIEAQKNSSCTKRLSLDTDLNRDWQETHGVSQFYRHFFLKYLLYQNVTELLSALNISISLSVVGPMTASGFPDGPTHFLDYLTNGIS